MAQSAEIKKDEIIAVVNDRVILRSDVEEEIKKIETTVLVKDFADLTEREILDKILEKMILDNLLIQAINLNMLLLIMCLIWQKEQHIYGLE